MMVLVAASIGLSACSGGGGGGSSAPEASAPVTVNSASDIVITPSAGSPQVSSQTATENTPPSPVTSTPTTASIQEPAVALTDLVFEVTGGSARKINLRLSTVPAEAELPGLGFNWTNGSDTGRMTYIDTFGNVTLFLFRCANGFYGDVDITMNTSDHTIVKTVTGTCR